MKKDNTIYWKFLWGFLKPYKMYLLVIVICGIIYSAVNAIIPIIESNILAAIGTSLFDQAIRLGILVLIIMMAVNILLWVYNLTYSKVYQNLVKDMSYRLAKETLVIETKAFDSHGSGEFINRMNRDPGRIAAFMNDIRNIVTYMIADIGVCIYIIVINPVIGILFFTLFIIPIFLWFVNVFIHNYVTSSQTNKRKKVILKSSSKKRAAHKKRIINYR